MKEGLFIILIALLASCSGGRYAGTSKLDNYYSIKEEDPPKYKLFSTNDSTILYFNIPATSVSSKGNAKLRIEFYKDYTKKVLLDSLGFDVVVPSGVARSGQSISGEVNLKTRSVLKKPFVAAIYSRDIMSNFPRKVIYVDSTLVDPSNYMLFDKNNKVVLNNVIKAGVQYSVRSKLFKGDEVTVAVYPVSDKLPKPPFANYTPPPSELNPTSEKIVEIQNGRFYFDCPENSFVVLTSLMDPSVKTSYISFDKNYPEVTQVEVMIDALRYITTEDEYAQIENSQNAIQAIDDFWLLCSGSKDRARQLIRSYYKRVGHSNQYFSSHIPGWKSDRGLIYVIFGPPKTVLLSKGKEMWSYGEVGSMDSITFEFVKVNNPYFDTDYRMIRNENYKPNWYRVVGAWREGRIFYK